MLLSKPEQSKVAELAKRYDTAVIEANCARKHYRQLNNKVDQIRQKLSTSALGGLHMKSLEGEYTAAILAARYGYAFGVAVFGWIEAGRGGPEGIRWSERMRLASLFAAQVRESRDES